MVLAALLWSTWASTLIRTVLVADAIWHANGGRGMVAGTVALLRRRQPLPGSPTAGIDTVNSKSQARRQIHHDSKQRSAASKFRWLHTMLLLMHITASISTSAAVYRLVMPISKASCYVTKGVAISMIILFDSWLILFLLAKADVTNKTTAGLENKKPCWERGVVYFSLFWAYIFLPFSAVMMFFVLPETANEERTECISREDDSDKRAGATGILLENSVIAMELLFLLLLFVRPLLNANSTNLSSAIAYRRVVVRNVLATAAILAVLVLSVAVLFASVYLSTSEAQDHLQDLARSSRMFWTLCVTEISIPLGCTSSFLACRGKARDGQGTILSSDQTGRSHSGGDPLRTTFAAGMPSLQGTMSSTMSQKKSARCKAKIVVVAEASALEQKIAEKVGEVAQMTPSDKAHFVRPH